MRFHTLAAVLLVAATASAQTQGLPTPECNDCQISIERPVQQCIKVGFSIGFDFADKVSTMPADEKQCVCAEVASNKWVNACRAICPAKLTDSMYKKFEIAKPQCVGVSAQPKSSNSVMGPLAPSAGAALAIAAAAAQAFL
ncbi:hypothetical protein BGZ70_004620 [Mortierella alpina]|uniref:Uncharacterized protein n=1 Tax=Mortierella alpina TaxID=64518 RepID=A0A9P6JD25_MORAP|nr:hypothetical protein BGZ70_004620 [Mortierella alpina]